LSITGANYIAYFFQTSVLPDNATNRTFQYSVGENPFIMIDPESDTASYKGLFFLKELDQASRDAGQTNYKYHITCKAKDGGSAPEDDVLLVVRFDK
jgi:hypothetical protein